MATIDDAIAQTLANLGMGAPPPPVQLDLGPVSVAPAAPDGTGGMEWNKVPGEDRAQSEEAITAAARQALAAQGRGMPPAVQEGSADLMRPPSPDAMQSIEMGGPTDVPADPRFSEADVAPVAPAAVDPYDDPNRQPGSVADATDQANDQLTTAARERAKYSEMKLAAQTDRDQRIADAHAQAAEEQGVINQQSQAARQLIQAKADASTASWIQELQDHAKKEPNPGRWWDNQSGLGKAMWAMSMVFGAAYTALTPGAKNAALEMVRNEIQNDIATQRARLAQEASIKKLKGETKQAQHARDLLNIRDDHTAEMVKLQALERAWVARESVPGDLDAQAAKQEGLAWLQEQKLGPAERYRQEEVAKAERQEAQRFAQAQAAASRAFQARQDAIQRSFQADQKKLDRDLTKYQADQDDKRMRDLAPVSISATGGSPRNPTGKDGTPLYYELSNRADAKGKPQVTLGTSGGQPAQDGAVLFKDQKDFNEANAAVETADAHFEALTALREALKSEGPSIALTGVMSPQVEAKVKALGYAIAQSQNKQVTDKDFSAGVSQAIGFDPDGNWLQRGKFVLGRDEVEKMLDQQIGAHHKHVEAKLQRYNNAAINGQGTKILYRPADLAADPAPLEKNAADIRGEGGAVDPNKVRGTNPVKGVKDYLERSQTEAVDPEQRGTLLPDHDRAAVQSFMDDVDKRGPKTIEARAKQALKALDARADELSKKFEAAGDTWSGETSDRHETIKELQRTEATRDIITSLRDDSAKKAARTIDRVKRLSEFRGISEKSVRKIAREEGLEDDHEVRAILDKFAKEPKHVKRLRGVLGN